MYTCLSPLFETVQALQNSRISLPEYIQGIWDRIESIEPHLHTLLPEPEGRERLLQEGQALERQYPEPQQRPALYAILLGVKDIIQVDGFVTRGGSALPPELFRGPEASMVTRLREAGALILGKTITTEFAYLSPAATLNPHNPAHTPGGSSSGSAAAVAAGFCQLALGTQTIGSVIRPAAFCGIVGFKPSYGRIPIDGVIPCSISVDHVGLFTQDVKGMALAAAVLCQPWRSEVFSGKGATRPVLGIPEGPYLFQAEEEALSVFEQQLHRLQAHGYKVVRVPMFADIEAINQEHKNLVAFEMAQVHATWYKDHGALYQPITREVLEKGQKINQAEAEKARQGRFVLRKKVEQARQARGVDLWISPAATGPAPRGLGSTGNPIMNLPWTYMGLPVLTVPAGRAENGLPLGLQLAAGFGQDEILLHWGIALESLFRFAKPGLLKM
jgi:Asp-tRNA(Asn)/Glu-tRNA(Gln) amidotransferase A subunit family amidase